MPSERADRLRAARAGDDYELLFAAPPGFSLPPDIAGTRIGTFARGDRLTLRDGDEDVPLPASLGFEHG